MALSFDTANLVIESTASITDLPAFHADLRDWEDSPEGAVWPVTHSWKALDLGGGAYFYQADLANGWKLKFPNAGNYAINGNLNGTIVPVAGVFVERKTSAAYATTAIGGSGPSAADIAAATWEHASASQTINRLAEVWGRLGLNAGQPVTQGNTQISFGDIVLALALDGNGNGTITRQ